MRFKYPIILLFSILFYSCGKEEIVEPGKIGGNIVTSIVVDASGNKWMAHENGISVYNGKTWKNFKIKNQNTDQKIKNLLIKKSESGYVMYALSDQGIFKMKINGTSVSGIEQFTISKFNIRSDTVNTIYDKGNEVWCGTLKGPCSFKTEWSYKPFPSKLNYQNITTIAFDGTEFYFGTAGRYLYRVFYNSSTDAITGASQWEKPYNGEFTSDTILSLCADSKKNLWIGSTEGLSKHAGTGSTTTKEYATTGFEYFVSQPQLNNSPIYCIAEDKNANIWVGTANGLGSFDGIIWKWYVQGLPSNKVLSIAFEGDVVWVGTDNGLVRLVAGNYELFNR